MTSTDRRKPFALIREFHLADWFTLANAFCGMGALFSVMSYLQTGNRLHVYFACGLIPVALVFDLLDGSIARWRQQSSVLGRELDSLADVISFGVAPAVLGFTLGLRGGWGRASGGERTRRRLAGHDGGGRRRVRGGMPGQRGSSAGRWCARRGWGAHEIFSSAGLGR